LKSAVYGGLDSVVNSLTIILGGVGSNSLPSHILAIGVAALIGDGLGMGLGDYLSAKAEK
jgi:VIT1/CCC1 family predicted Fe2+/Mn2+ transporter